tara:strand:- start:371 stop:613 length:243 start_codon:yes stop_codon:yes gene_type:complete
MKHAQTLRILENLPVDVLNTLHDELIMKYNLYHHNNDGKDDIGGVIALTLTQLQLDIKLVDLALHDLYAQDVMDNADLPF